MGMGRYLAFFVSHMHSAGLSLELSDWEKFCDILWISGRSFGPNFLVSYMFYTFYPSAQTREM